MNQINYLQKFVESDGEKLHSRLQTGTSNYVQIATILQDFFKFGAGALFAKGTQQRRLIIKVVLYSILFNIIRHLE